MCACAVENSEAMSGTIMPSQCTRQGNEALSLQALLCVSDTATAAMLVCLTTPEATKFKATCKAARERVASFAWCDMSTHITCRLNKWHACFPHAHGASFYYLKALRDDHVVAYVPTTLRSLSIAGCTGLTDLTLAHLPDLESLDIRGCKQEGITAEGVLSCLPKLRVLYMGQSDERRDLRDALVAAGATIDGGGDHGGSSGGSGGTAAAAAGSTAAAGGAATGSAAAAATVAGRSTDSGTNSATNGAATTTCEPRSITIYTDHRCTDCRRYRSGAPKLPPAGPGVSPWGFMNGCLRTRTTIYDGDFSQCMGGQPHPTTPERIMRKEYLCDACAKRARCDKCEYWECDACMTFSNFASGGWMDLDFYPMDIRRCGVCKRRQECVGCREECRVCRKHVCSVCVELGSHCVSCGEEFDMVDEVYADENYGRVKPEDKLYFVCDKCDGEVGGRCPGCDGDLEWVRRDSEGEGEKGCSGLVKGGLGNIIAGTNYDHGGY